MSAMCYDVYVISFNFYDNSVRYDYPHFADKEA